MGFTVEDRHLIKCLRVSKGYGATRLCKMFPDRHKNVDGVKTLIKKTDMTGSINWQRGSGRPRSARTPDNVNEVEGRALIQEDKPQTYSSQRKIVRRKVVLQVCEVVWNTLFMLNIPWKFCVNLIIFQGDIDENESGCFFLNTVYYDYVSICKCPSLRMKSVNFLFNFAHIIKI